MTRVWLILFTLTFSTAFHLWPPSGHVYLPLGNDYKLIPMDVHAYNLIEHGISITMAFILLSTIHKSIDKRHETAYIAFVAILFVDAILYSFYYRGWMFEKSIPWNLVKTGAFGVITLYLQWQERRYQ